MFYLIDGYNLLYALGILPGRAGPGKLEAARLRLLDWLLEAHGDDGAGISVIFDAARAPARAPSAENYRGIQVRFAVGHDEADDLIEQLIHRAAAPEHIIVVSNDHRIQRAARRRNCRALDCAEYFDWLERQRRPAAEQTDSPTGKPDKLDPEETQRWLREFGDLEKDPGMKELFDPFDFGKDLE